jgi:hypothetical protein
MKYRPILFSGLMVRAILEDRKTKTRRIVKPISLYPDARTASDILKYCVCPYGMPGYRLWVRETWRVGAWDDIRFAIDYKASPELKKTPLLCPTYEEGVKLVDKLLLELDNKDIESDEYGDFHWPYGEAPLNWRPSIFMPRWASRITLEITDVRVERLQEITEEDAIAEGIFEVRRRGWFWTNPETTGTPNMTLAHTPRQAFRWLWNSITGTRLGCSWASNPWVWAIQFKRVALEEMQE